VRTAVARAGGEASLYPYFEDLEVGGVFAGAPGLTLTAGHAALHQAILGDRLRLPLDAGLSARVVGAAAPLAHPGLVCDVAIGQSTLVTGRVIGNLFYRGLALRRAPLLGDTLRTTTEVVGLRQNRPQSHRPATGMAVLRVRTVDQEERPVLDFFRCAMLPLRDPEGVTGRDCDLDAFPDELSPAALRRPVEGWLLEEFREAVPGPRLGELGIGQRWEVTGGDVVSSAPELARLTLNVAMTHHDVAAGRLGRRLVYGGHTIGVAASQLARVLPNLVTIVAWHSCEHLGPVFEGDTIRSEVELERVEPLPGSGGIVHLRSRARADRDGGQVEVLDWRLAAVMA
jgi:acyl dehydratase